MGICGSKGDRKIKDDEDEDNFNKKKNMVKARDDFNPGMGEIVVENKNKITREYNLLSPPLGKGAFGEVRQAINRETGLKRAIKIIQKSGCTEKELKRIIKEVEILKKLDHPNIIKVFEFFKDDNFIYIVTDLCTGGELFDRIIEKKRFNEKEAADTMHQIMSAVVYCHNNNIVHRDLKPENILLESKDPDSNIKVIDFGTSRVYDKSTKMGQRLGTPYYIAPEVLEKDYTEKCDVWSCGVIMYIILSGIPPFNGHDDQQIMEKVATGVYTMDIKEFENVSTMAKSLIKSMLEFNPNTRISAQKVINHEWFKAMKTREVDDPSLSLKTLKNLKLLNYKGKLQKAIYYFIVTHMATKEEKAELLKVFKQLDTNGDGQLTMEELKLGYDKTIGITDEEINQLMAKLDNDRSGAIDYTEFVAAAIDRNKLLTRKRIESCFKMFDKDKSGGISKQELKEMFGGIEVSDEVWKELIHEVDDDDNGEIEYKEFKEMLMRLIDK